MAVLQAYRLCIYSAKVTVVKKIYFLCFQISKQGSLNSLIQLFKAVIFSSCLPFSTITYSCMYGIQESSKQIFHISIQNKHKKILPLSANTRKFKRLISKPLWPVCASFHFYPLRLTFGLPWWLRGQESAVSAGDTVLNLPWVGKILWRRK